MEQTTSANTSDVGEGVSLDRDLVVRHFRQIVLWPLQLMPIRDDLPIQKHCDFIQGTSKNSNMFR